MAKGLYDEYYTNGKIELARTGKNVSLKNHFTKDEILIKIKSAGIVGLGGATFPAHVKLAPPPDKKAEVLIINAVECEPYLTCDHQLMMEKGEEIMVGITILMKVLEVEKAVIGIENNKKDAVEHLSNIVKSYPGITIQPLKVRYPQGGEKQLIDAVLKRQVPSGKIPIEVGTVVMNVATTFAVYEAVQKEKPLIERVMTVSGKDVQNPGNYLVRLGIYLSEVVNQAGGVPEGTGKIIGGGPMMGRSLMNLDVPAAKGSAGIVFMTKKEALRREMFEETGINTSGAKVTLLCESSGEHEKTLRDTGERVFVKMDFYNYRIDLKQDADQVILTTEDDWHEPRWFKLDELHDANLSEPTRSALVVSGII